MEVNIPTKIQEEILRANGWSYANGSWYKCRYCHKEMFNHEYAWFSPRASGYHPGCILKSKQVQKLLKVKE